MSEEARKLVEEAERRQLFHELRLADALEAALDREERYRIEADEAMRDYEDLELAASKALDHLNARNRRPEVREARAILDTAVHGEGPRAALSSPAEPNRGRSSFLQAEGRRAMREAIPGRARGFPAEPDTKAER